MSLTARLTLYYALTLAALMIGMAWIVRGAAERHFVELDQHVLADKAHLVDEISARATSMSDLKARLDEALHSHHGLYVWIFGGQNALYAQSDFTLPPDLLRLVPEDASAAWFGSFQDKHGEFRVLRAPLASVAAVHSGHASASVWVAIDTQQHTHFSQALDRTLVIYVVLAALLSGVLAWWAARSGLAPLRALRKRAEGVTAKRLHERLPVAQMPIEVADLAAALNQMLERLQTDFQRLSDFSSDLAHELRTPISNLLTQTQVALTQPREAAAYRDTLASNAEEFQRLARMVADMLLLAKTEQGSALPHRETVQLQLEARALFDFYEALAEESGIALDLQGAAEVQGDKLMLRRAISNLLANAIRHTPKNGLICIRISALPTRSLALENTGSEIEADDLPRLFDRFYRADKARSHGDADGVGLGLAITRAIMHAHGGEVEARSQDGKTCFTLRFADQR